jgi:hypothetical protein
LAKFEAEVDKENESQKEELKNQLENFNEKILKTSYFEHFLEMIKDFHKHKSHYLKIDVRTFKYYIIDLFR